MRITFFTLFSFILSISFSQNTYTNYYPAEKDSSGKTLRKPEKEVFEGRIKGKDTVRTGSYKLYYQFDPTIKLEGTFKDGQEHGTFTSYFPTGKPKWKRNYKNGYLDGLEEIYNQRGELEFNGAYTSAQSSKGRLTNYKQYDTKGNLSVTATYLNDTLHGKFNQWHGGIKVSSYTFNKGIKEGPFFIYDQSKGDLISKGMYSGGEINDTLYNFYLSGRLKNYIQFSNGKPHGSMMEFYESNQLKRKATYVRDSLSGPDSIFFESGTPFEVTNYERGARQGLFQEFHPNGQLKTVKQFINDKEHGEVKEYDTAGNLIKKSHYHSGLVHGTATMYYPTGETKAILHFIKNKKSGTHKYFYPSGNIQKEENFNTNGRMIASKEYYDSGVLKTERTLTYKEDKLLNIPINTYSSVKHYSQESVLTKTESFIEDKLHGEQVSFFADGSKRLIEPYNFGKLSGDKISFYKNGKTKSTEQYKSGKLNGKSEFFTEKGKTKEIIHFRNNKKHGAYELYSNKGKLLESGNYRNGLKDSKWTYNNEKGKLDHFSTYRKGVETK